MFFVSSAKNTLVANYAQKTIDEINYGSFDQPNLQLLNNYNFHPIPTILKQFGRVMHHLKSILKTFPLYITFPQIPKIKSLNINIKKLQTFNDWISSWSKKLHPTSAAVLF